MRSILFFSKKEFALIVALGVITGILDDKVEMLDYAAVAQVHLIVLANDYLQHVTGGPIFGDLLETWLEFGGVLAACLVRKPGAATIALTINGFCQVFVNGTHDAHLLYGAPGLGADLVFAYHRFARYDWRTIGLAGAACAVFWYPIVWFTHGMYQYPVSFLLPDFAVRVLGSLFWDGVMVGAIAMVLFRLARRDWRETRPLVIEGGAEETKLWNAAALLVVSLGALLAVLTRASTALSDFFLSVGPKIPAGIPSLEEYNPGYAIAAAMVFLALALLAFWHLRSYYSVPAGGAASYPRTP